MPKIVPIKDGYTPTQLRRLAATSKDANQSRRLLSIAAALDGMSRAEAAKIGGMDRQTRLGPSLQRARSRRAQGWLVPGQAAAAVRNSAGGVRGDRRDGPGSPRGRRRALAPD